MVLSECFLIILLAHSVALNQLNYRLVCSGKYHSKKPPGYFYYRRASVNPVDEPYLITTANMSQAKNCKWGCMDSEPCVLAQYAKNESGSPVCSYYNQSDIALSPERDDRTIFRYVECDINSKEVCGSRTQGSFDLGRIKSHRCQGLWLQYGNKRFVVDEKQEASSSITLDKSHSLEKALELCLTSIECDAINYVIDAKSQKPLSFQFIRTWVYNLSLEDTSRDDNITLALLWKCGNCSEHLSHGWVTKNVSILPELNKKYLSIFYSLDAFSCRQECVNINKYFLSTLDSNQLCNTVYYSNDTKLCLVEDHSNSTPCAEYLPASKYSAPMTKYSNVLPTGGYNEINENCFCLNCDRLAYLDDCGSPAWHNNFTVFNGSALVFTEESKSFDESIYRKFHTGYEYIWVKYEGKEDCIHICRIATFCEVFNADLNYPSQTGIKIIDRKYWGAQKPRNEYPFKESITCIEIEARTSPPCGCYTKANCADSLRSMQYFAVEILGAMDIELNFVIGDDGRIYEGRGWKYQSNIGLSYRESCIVIGLMGNFEYRTMSLATVNSLKAFIREGVKSRKISPDFTIREWGISRSDKRIFYNMDIIVTLWPNYAGRVKNHLTVCYSPKILIISCTMVSLILVALACTLLYLHRNNYFHFAVCKTLNNIILEKQNLASGQIIWSTWNLKESPSDQNKTNQPIMRRLPIHLNLISHVCIALDLNPSLTICNCCMQLQKLCTYLSDSKQYTELVRALEYAREDGFLSHCKKVTSLIYLKSKQLGEPNQLIFLHCSDESMVKSTVEQIICDKFCACRKMKIYFSEIDEQREETIQEQVEEIEEEVQQDYHERVYFQKFELINQRNRVQSWQVVMAEYQIQETNLMTQG